jgi:diadenylate cyclase
MPIIEILIISILINYILSFLWNTKSMDLVVGFFAFLLILGASSWFNLPVLHRIMVLFGNVLAIAVIVIFQPELRMALSKLSLKRRREREVTAFDRFLDQLANSIYHLAEKKVGALVVLENKDSLQEYAQKAVLLNAEFSSELLETIFTTKTPLHDGAVIIRDQTILAAAAILPLMEDSSQFNRSLGTRHRAGLGMSQTTDAVVIVVSEETGKISIVRDGIMTKGIKIDRFKGVLRSIFNPHDGLGIHRKFKILEWLKT